MKLHHKLNQNLHNASRITLFIFAFILLLSLSSCLGILGSTPEPTPVPVLGTASEQPLAGQGLLTCNQTCADQAQCGEAVDIGQVVLLHSAQPALVGHDLIVGTNFLAEIRGHQDVSVQQPGSGAVQSMRFYRVAVNDGVTDRGEAWVAGWCIQQ